MSNLWFDGAITDAVGQIQQTDKLLVVLGISTDENDQLSEMGKCLILIDLKYFIFLYTKVLLLSLLLVALSFPGNLTLRLKLNVKEVMILFFVG